MEDDWLVLDVPVGRSQSTSSPGSLDLVSLLERNATLRGNVKLVLDGDAHDGDARGLLARAEIAVEPGGGLEEAWRQRLAANVGAASAGISQALDWSLPSAADPQESPPEPGPGFPTDENAWADASSLLERCCSAGWTAEMSSDGAVRIPLESRRDTRRDARLLPGTACTRLRAHILPMGVDVLAGQAELAVSVLLLRASGAVRMVRAVTGLRDEPAPFTGFEVALPPDPSPPELGRALSALSVAVDQAALEVEALVRDSDLVDVYLDRAGRALRGWLPPAAADPSPHPSQQRRNACFPD